MSGTCKFLFVPFELVVSIPYIRCIAKHGNNYIFSKLCNMNLWATIFATSVTFRLKRSFTFSLRSELVVLGKAIYKFVINTFTFTSYI